MSDPRDRDEITFIDGPGNIVGRNVPPGEVDRVAHEEARKRMARVTPEQQSISWGDCWVRWYDEDFLQADEGFPIFSYTERLDEIETNERKFNITDDEWQQTRRRMINHHADGWRYGWHYSVVEPEGELGTTHISDIRAKITRVEFEEARAYGWDHKRLSRRPWYREAIQRGTLRENVHWPDMNFPGRPDHRDFHLLSDVAIRFDDEAGVNEEAFDRVVSERVDIDSATYLARQRIMRLLGPEADETLMRLLIAGWLEGFAIGHEMHNRQTWMDLGLGAVTDEEMQRAWAHWMEIEDDHTVMEVDRPEGDDPGVTFSREAVERLARSFELFFISRCRRFIERNNRNPKHATVIVTVKVDDERPAEAAEGSDDAVSDGGTGST